jgi:hypothetical protein
VRLQQVLPLPTTTIAIGVTGVATATNAVDT